MGHWLRTLSTKAKTAFMVVSLLTAQAAGAALPFMPTNIAHAAPVCTVDTAGANDEPGQKDLTKLCIDYAGLPNTVATTWNWDETGTNGANTMDACNLFDTDNDGNINYAVCVTTNNDPAVFQTLTTYSCGDDKIDRCTSPATVISSGSTSCAVSQQNTDPFPSGSSSPKDTQGSCTVQLSTIGGATAKLIDVCSYPSAQPNSDPSDCVIIRDSAGKVEVIKDLVPNSDPGLFNLSVDGPQANDTTTVNNVGDNGTTGEIVVKDGNVTIGETAGTNTSLSSYSTSIVCRDLNGTGAIVAQSTPSGSPRQLVFALADQADVVCVITNTASASITIVKDAVPNSSQDFAFTASGSGVSNFSLDDDADPTLSNTQTFNGLAAGNYSFTEAAVTGWDFDNITCSQGSVVQKNGTTVTITLSAGQNVTCTYTNRQRGHIVVHKVTNPANAPTSFQITASGTGSITGNPVQNITTSQDVTYDVAQGTYAVAESVPNGWAQNSNTCSNLVINGNTPLVNGVPTLTCTITNTKLAKLTIIKDALPNDPQDFGFTATGNGLSNFSLDDDSDATLSNTQTFSNLAPGSYSVSEQATSGWQLTHLACDTNNYTTVSSQVNVNLAAGQETTCTYTNTKLGSIAGTKYETNADSANVQPLSGWTINLYDGNNLVGTAVTDLNGNYSFTGLLPSNYNLLEVLISGWTQIYSPQAVNLTAGQNSTNNNFGNFHNGSIAGYKWNDANASGTLDNNEGKLSGWTINLFSGNQLVGTAVTDVNGNYSFTNLAPGTYGICEVQQTGWVQIVPANNACYTIVIDQSGETNPATNFGNQGRGTLAVVKNVDSDGDGTVDFTDVTNWNWNIDGSGNFATGSTNHQNVAAGDYTVSEVQKTDYHVTASSCTGEENGLSEEQSVTVSPGENVVCTFTNTRDTGTITVTKNLDPQDDNGLFDLQVDGNTEATDVSDGGTTGSVQVLTGLHNVGELAGTDTSLDDYDSAYVCTNGREIVASGNVASSDDFTVASGEHVSCTFTNTRHATLTIIKKAFPVNSNQSFSFTLTKVVNDAEDFTNDLTWNKNFQLDDNNNTALPNTDVTALSPGTYSVTEDSTAGWDLADLNCGDTDVVINDATATFTLTAGQQLTCTYTNQKHVVPQVLGDSTVAAQLTNTGLPIVAYTLAALTLLSTAFATIGNRKQTSNK